MYQTEKIVWEWGISEFVMMQKLNCKKCLDGLHDECIDPESCLCAEVHNKEPKLEQHASEQTGWILRLKQQIFKEQINEIELAHLRPNFYHDVNKYRMKADKNEIKIIDRLLKKTIRIRICKIMLLIDQGDMKKFKNKLTDEECSFWEKITEAKDVLMKTAIRGNT